MDYMIPRLARSTFKTQAIVTRLVCNRYIVGPGGPAACRDRQSMLPLDHRAGLAQPMDVVRPLKTPYPRERRHRIR